VLAVPIWKGNQGPVGVPALAAADNRTTHAAQVALSAAGGLSGDSTTTHGGAAAELWRRRLEGQAPDRQREILQGRLRLWLPGARITTVAIENLADAGRDLVLRCHWELDQYASAAGQRLLVNPHLFNRIAAADWAPGERRTDVDLGTPYEAMDEVVLTLPQGTTGVALPEPARLDAGPVGLYESSFDAEGATVRITRHMRLDQVSFPARLHGALTAWFGDIAQADDRALVVTLP
jgi:hypothetical protein